MCIPFCVRAIYGLHIHEMCIRDSSNTIRIRPLKESRYFPAVVIGGDDLLTEGKTPYWGAYYGVPVSYTHLDVYKRQVEDAVPYRAAAATWGRQ